MEGIFITGVCGYNNLGENPEDIIEKLKMDQVQPKVSPIKIPLPLTQNRRSGFDRYSLAVLSVGKRIIDAVNIEALGAYEIGTLFSTEFGSCHVNMKFLKALYTDGVQFVSPKQFSATVNNACLGPLCIKYGLKGSSTMLVNTNPVLYATRLLKTNKALALLVGAVDEYDEDYFEDFKNHEILEDGYNEGAAAFLLETGKSIEKTMNKPLARIISCTNIIDGNNPYKHGSIPVTCELMGRSMEMALERAGIAGGDLAGIFMTANSENEIYSMEKKAIESIHPSIHRIPLNAASHTNCLIESILDICIATLCLQRGLIPKISSDGAVKMIVTEKEYMMINGMTIDGSFSSVIIKNAN